jgi:hypothetical protein
MRFRDVLQDAADIAVSIRPGRHDARAKVKRKALKNRK